MLLFTLLISSLFTSLVAPISTQQIQDTVIPSTLRERKVIIVSGAVRSPMRVELRRSQIQLLEVLAYAGGLTERAKGIVQVIHSSEFPNNSGENHVEKTATYDLDDLLHKKSNPQIQHGDHIFVPEADVIHVIGSVLKPSAYLMKDPMRVSEAIKLAGGTLPDANSVDILLCSQSSSNRKTKSKSVTLKILEKDKSKDFILEANDIIFVRSRFPRVRLHLISCPQVKDKGAQLPLRVIY